MKNYNNYKFTQLIAYLIISAISIFLLLRPNVKAYVFSSNAATCVFILVWIILLLNFVFLGLDYRYISNIKNDYHHLYSATYSDSTGIPNRFSCDAVIEKYIDQTLPPSIGCVVIDLTNLMEINNSYSHTVGNETLKVFSSILSAAALDLCFVGRNGGNKFLAIFEDCEHGEIDSFLRLVKNKVDAHNQEPDAIPIEYKTGIAMNREDHQSQITKLISMANSRVYAN